MFSGRLTQATIHVIDWIAIKILPPDQTPDHLRTGRRGEEDAYFYLRRLGYVMVARNFRLPPSCQWRFDVISVYYEHRSSQPQIELFKNISPLA
jgi:hypothetical protein